MIPVVIFDAPDRRERCRICGKPYDSNTHSVVRFIGIGESAEDMQPFVAAEFADALLASGAKD